MPFPRRPRTAVLSPLPRFISPEDARQEILGFAEDYGFDLKAAELLETKYGHDVALLLVMRLAGPVCKVGPEGDEEEEPRVRGTDKPLRLALCDESPWETEAPRIFRTAASGNSGIVGDLLEVLEKTGFRGAYVRRKDPFANPLHVWGIAMYFEERRKVWKFYEVYKDPR